MYLKPKKLRINIALLAFHFQVYATRGKEGMQEEKQNKLEWVQSASCSKQKKTDLEGDVITPLNSIIVMS